MTNNTANSFVVRAAGGFWFGDAGSTPTFTPGALISTSANGAYLSTGGSWTDVSDVNLKENFSDVDPNTILDKVAGLPITSWNYIVQGDSVRHIGPMAQDFYAAFGTGEDDKHISTLDSAGVALAAIQGLYQVVQDKDAQIATLQTENAELKTRLDDLDQRLSALEALAAPAQAGVSMPVMLAGVLLVGGMGFAGRRFVRKGGL